MTSPYREGKPVVTSIAPDRRRQQALALVAGGMVAGIVVWELAVRAGASPTPPVVSPATVDSAAGPLSATATQRVVSAHASGLRRACWSGEHGGSAQVTLRVVVEGSGRVLSATTEGAIAPKTAACIENDVLRWSFPAHDRASATVLLPLSFETP